MEQQTAKAYYDFGRVSLEHDILNTMGIVIATLSVVGILAIIWVAIKEANEK